MPVTVFIKATGEKHRGKFATIRGGKVSLFSEIKAIEKGRCRGCGEKIVFPAAEVDVLAHNREVEIRED